MKNNNSTQKNVFPKKRGEKTRFYLFSKLGSAMLLYMVIAFGIAIIFDVLLNTVSPPEFISDHYWFNMFYDFLPYIFMLIFFIFLFRRKINYINDIHRGLEIIKNGNTAYEIPICGHDELSSIATGINELQQTLNTEIESKEKTNQENHLLVTSVSQNINTPIRAVIAYLESIRESQENNPIDKNTYEAALENACQVKGLINNFFEHSIDDDHVISYDFKVHNGNKIMSQITDEITFSLEEAGFKIVLENCIDREFLLKVDLNKFRHIFDNLVSNILKYADPGKPIDLGLILNKNELCIIQRNKTKKNIRVSVETPIDNDGHGLDICKKIILRHQGRINYYQLKSMFKVELSLPIYERETSLR